LRSFEHSISEFDRRHVSLVAISVDPLETTRELREKQGYTFRFLADTKAEVIRRYDLLHAGAGEKGEDLARPAEFLVDATGTIRWVNLTDSLIVRARPGQVLNVIDSLHLSSNQRH
jgi:peroxiredoxin